MGTTTETSLCSADVARRTALKAAAAMGQVSVRKVAGKMAIITGMAPATAKLFVKEGASMAA